MSRATNWYVLTGGPSSGKTTLLAELQKQGYAVVPEAARAVIDAAIRKGIQPHELRKDERKFQHEVMRLKMAAETVYSKSVVTFFDRGMHDTIAYFRHYGYEVDEWIKKACESAEYQKIFLLEPLEIYEENYARTEDKNFYQQIHHRLKEAYEEAGMHVVSVPPVSLEERVNIILTETQTGVTTA